MPYQRSSFEVTALTAGERTAAITHTIHVICQLFVRKLQPRYIAAVKHQNTVMTVEGLRIFAFFSRVKLLEEGG